MTTAQSRRQNRLLALLSEAEYLKLDPHLRDVDLSSGQILYEPEEPISTAYFPTRSMISLVQIMENGSTIEAGVIGSAGLLGYPVYLDGQCMASQAVVQIPGSAIAIDAAVLKRAFDQGGSVQRSLLRYTQAFITQISQTAVCNRFHSTDERLARWLLQAQDCAQSNVLLLTQDFLSSMLGTRRASITASAIALQRAGLIRYYRGRIQILDRESLKSLSCQCYSIVRAEYGRLLDSLDG